MTTPADLRLKRILLGLTQGNIAKLLNISSDEARELERMRNHRVFQGHTMLLEGMLQRVNNMLEADTAENVERPPFLFCYPNDEVFAIYEPELAPWMHYNSVHQMYIARLLDAWMQLDHEPTVIEIIPKQYEEFRGRRPDSLELRVLWARAHLKVVAEAVGVPIAGQILQEDR